VYSHSKGRTPGVFVFNPFAEGYIALGKRFTPVKHQSLLARDLANLPQFLCRADDIVLVTKRPATEFLSGLKQAGFALPEFVELKAGRVDEVSGVRERKLGGLRPWAWGPDSAALLQPLFANVSGETRTASERFNANIARLYSKSWSAEFLRKALANRKIAEIGEGWLCTEREVGVAVNSLAEALAVIAAIRGRGHHRVVAKLGLGLAGQSALRLWEPEVLESQRQWLANAFENGQEVVIEPWLEREMDFSVQLEMSARELKLLGYTGLLNDAKGQFQANWAEANFARRVPNRVSALFEAVPNISGKVQRLYAEIFLRLEADLRAVDFTGPIGLDAFVYKTASGERRVKPVVEINPRYTMGRLTLELMKHAAPGSSGVFRLVNGAQLRVRGAENFPGYARGLRERFPLRLEGEPVAKIREGALCLNDPAEAQVVLATFQAGRNAAELMGAD